MNPGDAPYCETCKAWHDTDGDPRRKCATAVLADELGKRIAAELRGASFTYDDTAPETRELLSPQLAGHWTWPIGYGWAEHRLEIQTNAQGITLTLWDPPHNRRLWRAELRSASRQ